MHRLLFGGGELRRHTGDGWHVKRLGPGVENQQNQKARQEIGKGPRHKNEKLLPIPLAADGPGIIRILVLSLHGAVAAHGEDAEGILRLSPLSFKEGRTHADGKLVNLHAAGLGGQKVSQLVERDKHAKHENRRENVDNCHKYS
ncbi:hypothetical protein SDC9_168060 [bioreactor metagenome]|uniref:Uncharacterized protein n=1 Tax=bioreactor metagenome TaxID=1076179 RepID=A0A645G1I5_9ZZZZ